MISIRNPSLWDDTKDGAEERSETLLRLQSSYIHRSHFINLQSILFIHSSSSYLLCCIYELLVSSSHPQHISVCTNTNLIAKTVVVAIGVEEFPASSPFDLMAIHITTLCSHL